MENEIEDVDSSTDIETEDSSNENDDVEVLKKKNQELYEQLKKAKGFERNEEGKWVKKENPKQEVKPEVKPEAKAEDSRMSETDMLAVIRAEVSDEDLAYVKKYALLEGVTVAEALKKDDLKEILKAKQEMRKSAEVANTIASRKGPAKVSDEALLDKAKKGDLPDSEEEIMRLTALRRQAKAKK